MTSARKPLPTDIVALVSFDGRVHPNEAKPLDRLGLDERAHPLETAIEQWFSFATGKSTWVSVRGATIRGLISARQRAKKSAWEVDALIEVDDDESVALSLLSRMTAGVVKQRAERVFLRLDAESHLAQSVRKAEFFPYSQETLYRLDGKPSHATDGGAVPIRARSQTLMGVFQLYSRRCRPTCARSRVRPSGSGRRRRSRGAAGRAELVLEEDGIITAWLRVLPGQTGRFSLIARSEAFSVEEVVQAPLCRGLQKSKAVLCLVPITTTASLRCLEQPGFRARRRLRYVRTAPG